MSRLILLLLLVCGCRTVDLDKRFEPLKYASEGVTLSRTSVWTLGNTMYCRDIDKYKAPVAESYVAVLLHEQSHAARQAELGKWRWLRKYFTDTDFRRKEELAGWYIQLKHWQIKGIAINVSNVARFLSNNYLGIMSRSEAESWVVAVLNGSWRAE